MSFQGRLNPHPLGLLDTFATIVLSLGIVFTIGIFSNKWMLRVHVFLSTIFILVLFTSWHYFDYFRSLYTFDILAMQSDLGEGARALNFDSHSVRLLVLCTIVTLFTLFAIRATKPTSSPAWLVALLFLGSGITGIALVESSLNTYKKRGAPWLHPANLHPVHALLKSSDTNSSDSNTSNDALNFFRALNQHENQAISPVAEPYNVLIVLLESFRADLTGVYGDGDTSITPSFDAIAQDNSFISQYYSNTTHTISAEVSIWCGIFDETGEKKFAYQEQLERTLPCLPTVLRNNGYESFYFHGNKSKFYNRDILIPKLDFDQAYFHADEDPRSERGKKIGWGVDDETMFKIMLERLESERSDSPFLAHITTLSNHYPFHWEFPLDEKELPNPGAKNTDVWPNYENAVFYTDYALGKFWQRFKESTLSENTIVIITSDHGIWRFEEDKRNSLANRNERFYRAPFVVYHPEGKLPKSVDIIGSHIDVMPSLLGLLGIPPSDNPFGKNLYASSPNTDSSWAIMNKGVDHILRYGDKICYFNIDHCETNQQDCSGWLGDIILGEDEHEIEKCGVINQDLLKGGNITEIKDEKLIEMFQAAQLAIQQSAHKFSN